MFDILLNKCVEQNVQDFDQQIRSTNLFDRQFLCLDVQRNRWTSGAAGIVAFKVKPKPFGATCVFKRYSFWEGCRSPVEPEVVAMEYSFSAYA